MLNQEKKPPITFTKIKNPHTKKLLNPIFFCRALFFESKFEIACETKKTTKPQQVNFPLKKRTNLV